MTTEVESYVEGFRSGAPVWSLESVEVTREGLVARFRDGFVRTVNREEALAAMPEQFSEPIATPSSFAEGKFDEDFGTVVWPNGADLAPEFLRWGAHKPEGCDCESSEPTS